ncbi:MAG: glycosyltransferase family 2 protein [Bacteroidales bacterium]
MTISIITTTYNSYHTLSDTIESILSQTYNNIEYIIVDGASNDGTIQLIKDLENRVKCLKDYREFSFKYISEPDKGIYDAMNKGIKMATGDVVGILNSDDFFSSNDILQNIANAFNNQEIDVVYGDVHFVSPANLKKCVRYYSSKIFHSSLMRFGFMPAHPSCYIKREWFNKITPYKTNYQIAADFEFLLRLIVVEKSVLLYLPIDMVTMRLGGASTNGLQSYVTIMKEHLQALRENKIYSNIFILSLRYFYKIWEMFFFKKSK